MTKGGKSRFRTRVLQKEIQELSYVNISILEFSTQKKTSILLRILMQKKKKKLKKNFKK